MIKKNISPIGPVVNPTEYTEPILTLKTGKEIANFDTLRLDTAAGKVYLEGAGSFTSTLSSTVKSSIPVAPTAAAASATTEPGSKPATPAPAATAEPLSHWAATAFNVAPQANTSSQMFVTTLGVPAKDKEGNSMNSQFEFEVVGLNEGNMGFRSTWQDQGALNFIPRSVADLNDPNAPQAELKDNLPVLTVWGQE